MWLVSKILYQEKSFIEPLSRAQLCVRLEDEPWDRVEKELEPLSVMSRVGGLFPFSVCDSSCQTWPQLKLSLRDLPSFLTQNVFPQTSQQQVLRLC